jgi:hypothetical protein
VVFIGGIALKSGFEGGGYFPFLAKYKYLIINKMSFDLNAKSKRNG